LKKQFSAEKPSRTAQQGKAVQKATFSCLVSNSQSVKKKVRPKRTKEEEPLKNEQRVVAIPKKKILKKGDFSDKV